MTPHEVVMAEVDKLARKLALPTVPGATNQRSGPRDPRPFRARTGSLPASSAR